MKMIAIIIWLGAFGMHSASVDGWKGIVPLHSTRADVERLLGPPTEACKEACEYDTKSEGVFVRYSSERCSKDNTNGWNVPPDTVLSLSVNMTMKPKLSDLKLNLKKFTKTKDPELHGYTHFENEEDGVSYAVSDEGLVYRVEWFGTAKDAKALRCGSARVRRSHKRELP